MNMAPKPERWPVAIRAYAVPDIMPSGLTKRKHAKSAALEPSYFTLIFDCETFAEAQPTYRYSPQDIASLQAELARLCDAFSAYEIALYGQMKPKRLADFVQSNATSSSATTLAKAMERGISPLGSETRSRNLKL